MNSALRVLVVGAVLVAVVHAAGSNLRQAKASHTPKYCTNAMVQRRRRDDNMCACRRRSGSQGLPNGWSCLGDAVNELPTSGGTPAPSPSISAGTGACLCVFDLDRTLTGRQENVEDCPRNKMVSGITDPAYDAGTLTLSALAAEGISTTFCGGCYLGMCSAGNAAGSGSKEREYLLEHVLRTAPFDELASQDPEAKSWSYGDDVRSPLVLSKEDKTKQFAVQDIHEWYRRKGIEISFSQVHFFGDRTENIEPFWEIGAGFNAHEISCASRDWRRYGSIGYCGAKPEEIGNTTGIISCADKEAKWLESAACDDAPGWSNNFDCRAEGFDTTDGCGTSGWTCAGYSLQGWCSMGALTMRHRGAYGAIMNHPEEHCCVCGGGINRTPTSTTLEPQFKSQATISQP